MSDLDKQKLTGLLMEYQSLKEEERTIYSFEFSIISIWLAFLGVLFGSILSQFDNLYDMLCSLRGVTIDNFSSYLYNQTIFPDIRNTISFFLLIIFPGICSIFGLIWLDLTTRFVKEAHYIYLIERNIQKLFDGEMVIGFEHFLYEETKGEKRLRKTNYIYYYLMLGLFFIVSPIVAILFLLFNSHTIPHVTVHWILFIVIELLTSYFCLQYVKRILSYPKAKSSMPIICKATDNCIDNLK